MGKNYVEFKYGKGLVVLDVLDIKKHIPSELWWEGIKRGKSFRRTNESYERKGNSRRANPQAITSAGGIGVVNAGEEIGQCIYCGTRFQDKENLLSHESECMMVFHGRKGEQT